MLKQKSSFLATVATFASSLVVMTSILGAPAFAEGYPNKTIRLLVPYAAGGGTDAIARVVAQGRIGTLPGLRNTVEPSLG